MSAADTTRKGGRGRARANGIAGERLWKSRSVETQKQGFHCAWVSRKKRGIPTFPQPRRRRPIKLKPDISCATKTGHFNLLTTHPSILCTESVFDNYFCPGKSPQSAD